MNWSVPKHLSSSSSSFLVCSQLTVSNPDDSCSWLTIGPPVNHPYWLPAATTATTVSRSPASCLLICPTLIPFAVLQQSLAPLPTLADFFLSLTFFQQPPLCCWDPQMKLLIVDFKMYSELNSVTQNSPVLTPRCNDCQETQLWVIIGQGDRPPTDQVVKTPAKYTIKGT